MIPPLQAADHYVRNQCGIQDEVIQEKPVQITKINVAGVHLEHYLRVLELQKKQTEIVFGTNSISICFRQETETMIVVFNWVKFNLTTGAPATNKDASKFLDLCGVKVSNLSE